MRPKILDTFTEAETPRDRRFLDLTGQTFSRLTVISFAGAPIGKSMSLARWNCLCACGNKVAVGGRHLRTGLTKSCGCLHSDTMTKVFTKHGESGENATSEYTTYCEARHRCTNLSHPAFADYGGRGIEFRFDSYEQFLATLGRKPTAKHTLDRIDNSGHYEPGNVRWATRLQQARNTRKNRLITLHGGTRCQAEWAVIYGISPKEIDGRRRRGWCDECAITSPVGGKHHARGCPHKST